MHDIPSLFKQLTALLQQTQSYWRPVAFHHLHLPWMAQHPALVKRLLALGARQVEQLAAEQTALLDFLVADIPEATELASLSRLPMLEQRPLARVSPHFHSGIPGRKWQQITAFAACYRDQQLPVLEWCAGKSYLGFYLQHLHQTEVTALEWDADLVRQANNHAAHGQIKLCSHQVDVLSEDVQAFIQEQQQVVALHACGELHESLLQLCVAKKVRQLHLAPCCYHKRRQRIYQPLSQQARQLNLVLNKFELHTAVMETVTAGATVQRQRKQLQTMRLGFDCLQRDISGNKQFLDLPSLPAKWARASFSDFCLHCASLKNITLPPAIDWHAYHQQGQQRFMQVAALDLVRVLFRRPLEVWLALDRALMMQENGYEVKVGTFCASQISPRNIMLEAFVS